MFPRLVISTTAAAFRQFEQAYGAKLPVFKGDYTPYWEDGAGSSARETALNRASGERLVQAEALYSIRGLPAFPASDAAVFTEADHEIIRRIQARLRNDNG